MGTFKELRKMEYGLVVVNMPPFVDDPNLIFRNSENGQTMANAARFLALDFSDFLRSRLEGNIKAPRLSIIQGDINWLIRGGPQGTTREADFASVWGRRITREIEVVLPLNGHLDHDRVVALMQEYAYPFTELNRVHGRVGMPFPDKVKPPEDWPW